MKTSNIGWLLGLGLVLSGAAFAEPTSVSGYEIKLYLSGKTAECVKTKDDSICDTYFAEDGGVKRFTYTDEKLRTGKWWVSADEQLCVQWTGKKKPLCFVIKDDGEGGWQLLRRGKLMSIVTSASPGDTIGTP